MLILFLIDFILLAIVISTLAVVISESTGDSLRTVAFIGCVTSLIGFVWLTSFLWYASMGKLAVKVLGYTC